MATKYQCDRCNKQYDSKDRIISINYPIATNRYNSYSGDSWKDNIVSKDFCYDCVVSLNDFMKPILAQKEG